MAYIYFCPLSLVCHFGRQSFVFAIDLPPLSVAVVTHLEARFHCRAALHESSHVVWCDFVFVLTERTIPSLELTTTIVSLSLYLPLITITL